VVTTATRPLRLPQRRCCGLRSYPRPYGSQPAALVQSYGFSVVIHVVYATDLVDYDSPDQDQAGWDFLQQTQLPIGVQMILTNPPFRLANQFVAHAIHLCPKVIMLARLAFLESEVRTPILEGGKLARVHVFRKRLPMMHRLGWDGPKATSATAYAWLVWDADHTGPTELHRL